MHAMEGGNMLRSPDDFRLVPQIGGCTTVYQPSVLAWHHRALNMTVLRMAAGGSVMQIMVVKLDVA